MGGGAIVGSAVGRTGCVGSTVGGGGSVGPAGTVGLGSTAIPESVGVGSGTTVGAVSVGGAVTSGARVGTGAKATFRNFTCALPAVTTTLMQSPLRTCRPASRTAVARLRSGRNVERDVRQPRLICDGHLADCEGTRHHVGTSLIALGAAALVQDNGDYLNDMAARGLIKPVTNLEIDAVAGELLRFPVHVFCWPIESHMALLAVIEPALSFGRGCGEHAAAPSVARAPIASARSAILDTSDRIS